jgi:hypothetical protein
MRLRACSSPRPRRTRRLWRSEDSGWKLDGVSDLVDSNGCSVSPDGFRCCGFGGVYSAWHARGLSPQSLSKPTVLDCRHSLTDTSPPAARCP